MTTVGSGAAGHRDQASALRAMAGDGVRSAARGIPSLAIASGKGGVGKTSIAVNLSLALARSGLRTVLLDGDLGLGNADVIAGVTPRLNLAHVLAGRCGVSEVMTPIAEGLDLVPGASGIARLADLSEREHEGLLSRLGAIERGRDLVTIDCGAGIGRGVLAFARSAGLLLVVVTPDPTAVTDAYALIKSLGRGGGGVDVALVVNQAGSIEEAREIHARIDLASRRFLERGVGLAGVIPHDPRVARAVRARCPFVLADPRGRASRAVEVLASRVRQRLDVGGVPGTGEGVIARILRAFGGSG